MYLVCYHNFQVLPTQHVSKTFTDWRKIKRDSIKVFGAQNNLIKKYLTNEPLIEKSGYGLKAILLNLTAKKYWPAYLQNKPRAFSLSARKLSFQRAAKGIR